MTSETAKAKSKLAILSSSFSELESQLEPLFSQTLPETLLSLEPIEQAKLQTLLTYVTYDLVFIYLKSRGIDPKTHPVISELDRIKGYFEKIDKAEKPETRHIEIDKVAAGRFIKHVITQAKLGRPPGEASAEPTPGPSNVRVPVKVTAKMLERQQYEKEMKERDAAEGSEESDLEVFDEEKMDEDNNEKVVDVKGKGKAKEQNEESQLAADASATPGAKRRRATVDPFAGYGDDRTSTNQPTGASSKNSDHQTKPKKKKQKSKDSTPASRSGTPNAKAEKKAKKKGTST
ncbi:Sas10/Utp3/C1D family-domain-containing protein [Desarmillaria tabescens]|uniref:Exosome complex protein n=1 Tax=Armillaria tabescens TaxID=1929756 RepID=A0AA39NHC6_ARMTA|nr:Sas10/Utp3/C1D family-domain-containing protein [Desarmillaria tabescens]KAK0465488.1 Sas10/Utp3/C1D family-domain-containing protein [Desarmillaria tabescens]